MTDTEKLAKVVEEIENLRYLSYKSARRFADGFDLARVVQRSRACGRCDLCDHLLLFIANLDKENLIPPDPDRPDRASSECPLETSEAQSEDPSEHQSDESNDSQSS